MDASSDLAPLHARLLSLVEAACDGLQQQEAAKLHAACTALSTAAKDQKLPHSAQKELWRATSTVWVRMGAILCWQWVEQQPAPLPPALTQSGLFPSSALPTF